MLLITSLSKDNKELHKHSDISQEQLNLFYPFIEHLEGRKELINWASGDIKALKQIYLGFANQLLIEFDKCVPEDSVEITGVYEVEYDIITVLMEK